MGKLSPPTTHRGIRGSSKHHSLTAAPPSAVKTASVTSGIHHFRQLSDLRDPQGPPGTSGTSRDFRNLQGAQGAQGPQGTQGPQGPPGTSRTTWISRTTQTTTTSRSSWSSQASISASSKVIATLCTSNFQKYLWPFFFSKNVDVLTSPDFF